MASICVYCASSTRIDPSYVAPLDNHSLPFPTDGQPIDLVRL